MEEVKDLYDYVLPEKVEIEKENGEKVMINNPLAGMIQLEVPDAKTQTALLKQLKYKLKDGTVEISDSDDLFLAQDKAREVVEKYAQKIEGEIKKTGQKLVSVSNLCRYRQGKALVQELASIVYNGIDLGND